MCWRISLYKQVTPPVGVMRDKPLWKSKTIWSAVFLAVIGVLKFYEVDAPYELLYTLAGSVGLVGIRQAIGNQK